MTGSVLIESEYEVADPSYIEYRTNRSLSYANSKESSFLCRSKGVISPENKGTCPLYSLKPVLQFALGVQVNHWNHSSYCPAIITHQRVLLFNNNNNKKNMTQKLKNLQSFTSKAALRSGHMHRFSWVRFNPPSNPFHPANIQSLCTWIKTKCSWQPQCDKISGRCIQSLTFVCVHFCFCWDWKRNVLISEL